MAHPVEAIAAVAGEVHMKMVTVIAVGVGAKHGRELATGAIVCGSQERALAIFAMPTALDGYPAAVG